MQESVQVNGRVPLPHIPRTYRMPKEIRVEPQKFAEELIHRLEAVQRTREAEEKLEERLKRVRMEEEGEDGDLPSGLPGVSHKLPSASAWHHFPPRCVDMGCTGLRDAHEENPESILDEHVQRVMRTPGCQSPGPGHRSPDSGHVAKIAMLGVLPQGTASTCPSQGRSWMPPACTITGIFTIMFTTAQPDPRSSLRLRLPGGSRACGA